MGCRVASFVIAAPASMLQLFLPPRVVWLLLFRISGHASGLIAVCAGLILNALVHARKNGAPNNRVTSALDDANT